MPLPTIVLVKPDGLVGAMRITPNHQAPHQSVAIVSSCGYSNFSKRIRCAECDKPRKHFSSNQRSGDAGRGGGDKGKGLFSPDDWNCKNCGNINWARRTTCNVCNCPRFNKLGERTGYGGGFMERDEVVEYKSRSRDDDRDEFDEFGRKKKPFRGQSGSHTTNGSGESTDRDYKEAPVVQELKRGDDDEEEESDDDNADLSKYAIWDGSDDEEGDEGNKDQTVLKEAGPRKDDSDSSSDSSASDSGSESSSTSVESQTSLPGKKSHSRGSRASSSSGSSSSHPTDDDDDDANEDVGRKSTRRSGRTATRDRSRSPLATAHI